MTVATPTSASEEDIVSIVIDSGSYSTRIGYSGDDLPKAVLPTKIGRIGDEVIFGEHELDQVQAGKEIVTPVGADGTVRDWEAIGKLWDFAISEHLRVDPSEFPLVVTEQIWNSPENRKKAAEIAFEQFSSPAFSLVKNPLCASIALGKTTSLVVDLGSSVASVTPVVEGNVYNKGLYTRYAGDFASLHVLRMLESRNIPIVPRYQVEKRNIQETARSPNSAGETIRSFEPGVITPSYHMYQTSHVLDEFKECVSQVSETPFATVSPLARMGRQFEFPDGNSVLFGPERLSSIEPLFNPAGFPLQVHEGSEAGTGQSEGRVIPPNAKGITDLIAETLRQTNATPEVFAALLSNVVLTGGTSLLSGFAERLQGDVLRLLPNYRPKVIFSASASERKHSVWTGASILSSVSDFRKSRVSRKEWAEFGPDILEEKFELRI